MRLPLPLGSWVSVRLMTDRFLTSLLYAVYLKIGKTVIAEFDRANATWWDSAVAGTSCLRTSRGDPCLKWLA